MPQMISKLPQTILSEVGFVCLEVAIGFALGYFKATSAYFSQVALLPQVDHATSYRVDFVVVEGMW